MRILADENMPYVEALFSPYGEVIRVPGRSITAEMLIDVDVLLVRSVTRVDAELLRQANKLSFVGSATIGMDHIDQALLAQRQIYFTNAPGCNAHAVCDYVLSALLLIAERKQLVLSGLTIGVIGIGNIGKRLLPRLEALGLTVLVNDPPRAENDPNFESVELERLLSQSDIVTLHVPLIESGQHPTHHLLAAAELDLLKPEAVLINACRGEVIDNNALLAHRSLYPNMSVVLDVWENEPQPNTELLNLVDIATPHIAGYSLEGKAFGTSMIYDRWAARQGYPLADVQKLLPTPDLASITIAHSTSQALLKQLVQAVYDVRNDDERMRANCLQPNYFDQLRKRYPLRRELQSTQITLSAEQSEDFLSRQQLAQLGFQIN